MGLPKLLEQVEIGLAAMLRTSRATDDHVGPPTIIREHPPSSQHSGSTTGRRRRDSTLTHIENFTQRVREQAKLRPGVFIQ